MALNGTDMQPSSCAMAYLCREQIYSQKITLTFMNE